MANINAVTVVVDGQTFESITHARRVLGVGRDRLAQIATFVPRHRPTRDETRYAAAQHIARLQARALDDAPPYLKAKRRLKLLKAMYSFWQRYNVGASEVLKHDSATVSNTAAD